MDKDLADSTISPSSQVRIQLSTKNPDIALPGNPGPILVNTNFRRYALSTLVNTLRQSEKPTPFEFLINGTFLRTSLNEYLTENGISAETTLAVEYVRAMMPPLYVGSFEHDDWVSSVDVLSASSLAGRGAGGSKPVVPGHERILSGNYDGFVRVWNMSSETLATSPSAANGGHTSFVLAVKFIDSSHIVSSGLNPIIRVWKYAEDTTSLSATIRPQIELCGHKAKVGSLAVSQSSGRLLSASDDHSVCLWSTKKSDAPIAPSSDLPTDTSRSAKRRKVGPAISTPKRGPLARLQSHTSMASDTMFAPNDHTVAYSTSWDHTLKTWDLPTSTCVDTRSASDPLFSLTALPELNLLAAGSSARYIILVDPRASATTVAAMTLRGHKNMIYSLATDPESSYGLVSGSADGTCRIWDVRSSKSDRDGRVGGSVYTIEREWAKGQGLKYAGEGVKVFGVCWDKDVGIASASEDKKVQINQGKGIIGDAKVDGKT